MRFYDGTIDDEARARAFSPRRVTRDRSFSKIHVSKSMLFIDIILIPTKSASASSSRLGGAQRSDVARDPFEIELTKFHERSRHIQQGHDLDIVHENFKPTTRSVSLYNHLRPRAFENERAERLSRAKEDASLFGRLGFRLLGRGFLLRRRLLLRRRFLLGYERSSKHTHGHRIIVSLRNSFARLNQSLAWFFRHQFPSRVPRTGWIARRTRGFLLRRRLLLRRGLLLGYDSRETNATSVLSVFVIHSHAFPQFNAMQFPSVP